MAHLTLNLSDTVGVSDNMQGVMRKVVDVGTEDMVIARFWVQNFVLLEKTTFDQATRAKLENILHQLTEDMLSLRNDIMGYVAEVKRYFEGVKSGEFYEKKENIEYFKEVFHGKKMVEDFYFHAELCKRDALRFLRIALPQSKPFSWDQYYQLFLQQPQHYRRLSDELKFRWEDLDLIRGIRGVIEHGDDDKDFGITDIYLEKTDKGTAFHQPYFSYPEEKEVKVVDGTKKTVALKGTTVIDIMDKHFWSIFNTCESCVVFPLYAYLDPSWQPKQLSLQSMDKKCPVRWSIEPATNPRKTAKSPTCLGDFLIKSNKPMNNDDSYLNTNKKHWNELTGIHEKSEFYEVEEFKAGKSSLSAIEIDEIGNVAGKSLLHLQCHFGLDTLSWAKLGAKVTGVDLSDESVALANRLSQGLGIQADFIASDIYKLPEVLEEEFDIVYTSGGVLCWLADLKKWAQIINRYLKPGGFFYIREEHPFANMFDHDFVLKTSYYFETGEPEKVIPKGSYADREKVVNTPSYQWHHSLGEIISSLLTEGLQLQFFHEFPYMGYARFTKLMEKNDDGWYRFKDKNVKLPLMFSLKAMKQK